MEPHDKLLVDLDPVVALQDLKPLSTVQVYCWFIANDELGWTTPRPAMCDCKTRP